MPPVKTAAGQDELTHRSRGLGQRHRTLLLLVDGRRSSAEVRRLAQQAGVPDRCFDELVSLGLVAPRAPSSSRAPGPEESSLLPSMQSLAPESVWQDSVALGGREAGTDGPLEEARALLMRAVRSEAPVTGTLTLLKLRRATTRDEVEALLDEVEQRIRKPRKLIIAAQTMRHVRHLLSLPGARAQP
jgi:hypothetical protein